MCCEKRGLRRSLKLDVCFWRSESSEPSPTSYSTGTCWESLLPASLTTELLGDLSRGCAWTPRARGPEVIGEGFSLVSARKALFLFDIEGAEFALLTDEVLERLSTSRGVVRCCRTSCSP